MRRFLGMALWMIGCAICFAPAVAFWQSRDSGYNVSVGGGAGAFTGPLDCSGCASSATIIGLWSLRCASATYSGNVADVYAPSDASHTLITCTTGGVLNETLQALSTTCATSCTIKTLYDQSGVNSCNGSVACDMAQATEANRPSFTTNCVNGKYCGVCTGASTIVLRTVAVPLINQPFMVSYVGKQNSTTLGNVFSDDNTAIQIGLTNGAAWMFAGTAVSTATATNNVWHSIQNTLNSASSEIYVDGSATGALNPGVSSFSFGDNLAICSSQNSNPLTGNFTEVSFWSGGPWTTGQKNGMTTSQRNYWNF